MNMFNNILRGPVTSTCGLLIILATVYSIEFKPGSTTEWIWSGLIGVSVGAALLLIPDKLGPILEKFIGKKSDQL